MHPDSGVPETEVGGYRLERPLGEGGMGVVYLATDAAGNEVVLKLIHPKFLSHTSAAARFAREAAVTAALSHPAIVRVLASDIEGAQPFIAMEYVAGRTLGAAIRDDAPLGAGEASELTQQVLSALSHAHEKGIVHRDLKPANVMLTRGPDGGEAVKILDFGIAGLFDGARHTRLTQTGQILGTPGYLSPEQAQGLQVDGRADLWAVGVMLYAMLTRQLPFPGDTASERIVAMLTEEPNPVTEFRTDLPPALVTVLGRMLTKDPAGRYQTAVEAALAIVGAVPRDWVDAAMPPTRPTVEPRTSGGAVKARPFELPQPRTPAAVREAAPGVSPRTAISAASVAPGVSPRPPARPFWGRPAGMAALFGASLLVGGAISGAFFLNGLFPSGNSEEVRPTPPVTPAAPVVPMEVAQPAPSVETEVTAMTAMTEGAQGAQGAEGDETGPTPARAASATRRSSGGSMMAVVPRAGTGTPATAGREEEGVVCPRGASIGSDGPGRSAAGVPNGVSFARQSIRPAFFIRDGESCLRGVRTGHFSVDLHSNASNEVERVVFTDPGPLTPRMQACLRSRIIANSSWNHMTGPDVVSLRRNRLVCF